MEYRLFGVGLSAFAVGLYTLPAMPAEKIAQAAPTTVSPKGPRSPSGSSVVPPPSPSGDSSRPNAGQPPATAQTESPPSPRIPTRTEILHFEGWTVTCNEFADGPRTRQCSAVLQIVQQGTNQPVFSWMVAVDDHKQLVSVMQTPTGVVIAPGVELRVGKLPPQKIPFASCDTGRCVATMSIDANLVREITTSPMAEAIIQSTQGNTVQFNIQSKGFDRAYAVLSR
jgi:invasion protein IalB